MEDKYEKSKIDITKIPTPAKGGINFMDFVISWNELMDKLKKEEDDNSRRKQTL